MAETTRTKKLKKPEKTTIQAVTPTKQQELTDKGGKRYMSTST